MAEEKAKEIIEDKNPKVEETNVKAEDNNEQVEELVEENNATLDETTAKSSTEEKAITDDQSTDTAQADTKEEVYAKSGKKSKKHVEEVKAEAERQARKVERAKAPAVKPKGATPVTRPRIERRGKNYQKVAKMIEKKPYELKDAIDLAIKTSPVKFDASVEIHARLGVDPRQADQNIRTTMVLPHGNGKSVRVAVFAPLDVCKSASAAGADIAEDQEFLKRLEKGLIDFDVLISTPQYMPKLGKYARMLGPKGLMPNPKAGTVTTDVEKAVKEAKAGKVEYRVDKQSIVHIGVGKVSFGTDKLLNNANAFFDSLKSQKPASLKGTYIKTVFITTTMGPSIQVENNFN